MPPTPEEIAAANAAAATAAAAAAATGRPATEFIDADVERIAQRYGGKDQAIRKLFKDGKRARDAKRVAEEALAAAKLPADGIVLSGDDRKTWDAFKKLGKSPDEITTVLTEHGGLKEKVTKTELERVARSAAKALNWNQDTAAEVVGREKLNVVIKTEKVDNRDVEVPYVQPPEQGAAPVRLADYANEHLKLYLPALRTQNGNGGNGGNGGGSAGGANGDARSTPYLDQHSATDGTSGRGGDGGNAPKNLLRETHVLPSQRNKK